jgi:erythromycin esterase
MTTDPQPCSGEVLAGWFGAHASPLATLDPHAPLDELEPLREIVGDARVVAVGENAHFVEEFSLARARVLRFLAERCGFSVFAFEFGFSEAFALDRWLQRAGDEADLAAVSKAATEWGAGRLMRWLRGHNRTSGYPLRLVGIDVPEAGGTLRPALDPVAAYLREVDPDSLPTLRTAVEISDRFAAGSGAAAAPAWARLEPAEQDKLSAALARLLLRMRALEPLFVAASSQTRFDIAYRRLEAACHNDYLLAAIHGLLAGHGRLADLSVRETFMAESVRWHLQRAAPGTRVVLAAHNNHVQKTPLSFDGVLTTLPMGQHLHRTLGSDYRVVALTHTADHVPEMYPDANSPVGFTLAEATLDHPPPGSVEAALGAAGLGDQISLTDLRHSPRANHSRSLLNQIRTQSSVLHTPLPEAFDAVLSVPTVTQDRSVHF